MKQIQRILSKTSWEQITIVENNENLVEVKESKRIKLADHFNSSPHQFMVRKTVFEKLSNAANRLPSGTNLMLMEGYRSVQRQQMLWDKNFSAIKKENPSLTTEQIERQLRCIVARPNALANHNCGGAVDVILVSEPGHRLDMGTPFIQTNHSNEIRKKYPMFPQNAFGKSLISRQQQENRALLRECMEAEEFVWYPGEWWHYCWGDRMWAVYSGLRTCFYGPVV